MTTADKELVFGLPVQTKSTEGGWGIEGLASTWQLDEVGDVILEGAFRESLVANPRPPLLWSHDTSRVLGRAEQLRETPQGLWGRWRISRTRDGEDARQLLLDEAVGGLSIGFRLGAGDYEHRGGVRRIKRLSLHEVSVCALPANLGARVTAVKAAPQRSLVKAYLEGYVARLKARERIGRMSLEQQRAEAQRLRLMLPVLAGQRY